MNPVDLTPGSMTNPKNRENLPRVLEIIADAPGTDQYLIRPGRIGFVILRIASSLPVALHPTSR